MASVRLERSGRAAAAASLDEGEFVRRLHQAGVSVRARFAADRDDVVAGYSVALRPRNGGEPIVWHGGGRLARDLTLPRLRDRWPDTPQSAKGGVDEWRATWRNPARYIPVTPGRELTSSSGGCAGSSCRRSTASDRERRRPRPHYRHSVILKPLALKLFDFRMTPQIRETSATRSCKSRNRESHGVSRGVAVFDRMKGLQCCIRQRKNTPS